MRNLQDWEHKYVLFCGFLEDWKPQNNKRCNILLSNITLRLVDGTEKRFFDHLWVHNYEFFEQVKHKLERLHKVFGVAEVIKYERYRNKTNDFSINLVDTKYCLEVVIKDLNKLILKNSARKKIKDKALFLNSLLKSKKFFTTNLDFNYQEVLEYTNKILEKLKRY